MGFVFALSRFILSRFPLDLTKLVLRFLPPLLRVGTEGSGQSLVSFCATFIRSLHLVESAEGAPKLNAKWRQELDAELIACGIDPEEVRKQMGSP
ncbi:MAG TPA: hypothetical protein VGN57_04815 [Pirellulaceae bacterium]|jgi:hypothetical protein|nr:hypothetical protein [Pirellulaceae bacterium]